MRQVLVTGSSGFVGKNVFNFLKVNYKLRQINRLDILKLIPRDLINSKAVIHLAGKAHDLRGISNSDEYYRVNTDLAKTVFDAFLDSDAKVFITLSSVKAVADEVEGHLTEGFIPDPITHYGKSKLLAEQYILSKEIPQGKRVYILRPCMIHGPGNKGNLNLLYKLVSKGIPWPLGAFENKRSFCSIDNLLFIIRELIEREDIPSGVYNVADDEPLSTNELVELMSISTGGKQKIWKLPKGSVMAIVKLGDLFNFPLNSERIQKLTESYVVSNAKIKAALGKSLPFTSKDGLIKTFQSFSSNVQ